MRIDTYTKTVLTLIALLLAVIAWRPIGASAQGRLAGVQYIPGSNSFDAFDANGAVYLYSYENGAYTSRYLGQITQLGMPMTMPPTKR